MIKDLYPLKAQFRMNEPVLIRLELLNERPTSREIHIELDVCNLTEVIETKRIPISIMPETARNVDIICAPHSAEWACLGVDVRLYEKEKLLGTATTAFDVTDSWRKTPRYGFLSGFAPEESKNAEDVASMLKFHINLVQFYDWVYRHDDYIPPQAIYTDLMGKPKSLNVIQAKIEQCHACGMEAIAYGAIYAASQAYFSANQETGLFTSGGDVYRFIDLFHIMDVSRSSKWRSHIIGEYKKALELGFDGIHMDTYGFPKSGISHASGQAREVHLEEQFPDFIHETREKLTAAKPDCCLIFNNVCNWPVQATAEADVDVVYIEVWEPYDRYFHIQQIIAWARYLGKGKPVVLAAYLKPFLRKDKQDEAENAARLLTASIAANGAYHLFLGETNAVLTQGYYPDYALMRDPFVSRMRKYYDFIVRYSQVLFDKNLQDVSMTHLGGDNKEYAFENLPYSCYAWAGKVWTIAKESQIRKVVHLINLTGNTDDFWNKGRQTPQIQQNAVLRVEVLKSPKRIFAASPDSDCRPKQLPFKMENGGRGLTARVELPSLDFWNMIVMEF